MDTLDDGPPPLMAAPGVSPLIPSTLTITDAPQPTWLAQAPPPDLLLLPMTSSDIERLLADTDALVSSPSAGTSNSAFVHGGSGDAMVAPPPPMLPMVVVAPPPPPPARPIRTCFFKSTPDKDTYEVVYSAAHLEVLKFEGDVYCYSLVPLEIPYKPCGVFLQQHFDRAFVQFSLTQRRGNIRPRRIEVWLNPELEQKFYAFQDVLKRKGDSLQELFVFHGSTPACLRSIMFEGFLIGGHDVHKQHGSVYGQGIYTSLCVDDAIQYSKGGRAVMMCLSLPGLHSRLEEVTSDSWSPRNQWRVFRKPEQLLPMCIVTY